MSVHDGGRKDARTARRAAEELAENGDAPRGRDDRRRRRNAPRTRRPARDGFRRARPLGGVAGGARVRDTFLGRRWWILAASAAVLSGLLGASVRLGVGTVPSVWLQDAITPAERALSSGSSAVSGLARDVTQLWSLSRQNTALRAEVARLQQVVLRDAELQAENVTLRQMLRLQTSAESRFHTQGLAAEVIARDPSTWFQSLVLDKGSADGVSVGMIAITPSGLVGRVVQPVALHSANLMLVTNPEFGVGTMVSRTGAEGAAVGRLGSADLVMTFFSPNAQVRVGDQVVTSGIGGEFPRGIPVGIVVTVQMGGLGLVRQAIVRPVVDVGGVGAVLLLPAVGGG